MFCSVGNIDRLFMDFQDITEYLHTILSVENDSAIDTFINVNTEDIPDVYLSVISGRSDEEEDINWESDYSAQEKDFADEFSEEYLDDEEVEVSDELPSLVLDVVNRERQVVILGNPGSGKTTLLKYLQHLMAKNSLAGNDSSDIPVYVPLKDLRKDRTLIDILMEYLQRPSFSDLFQQGRLFFLLDGLNEIQPDIYPSAIAAVNWLMERSYNCGLVVTSRLYGYAGQFRLSAYCLEGLTEENIRNYIIRRTDGCELYDQLSENDGQRDILKNPLLLSMVVSIWNTSHNLPTYRVQLYEWFIKYELDKAGIDDSVDRKDVLEVMSRLAFDMRRIGFLSDSCEGLETVIACLVQKDRVDSMTQLLLRSGLLAVTHDNDSFWCISFIHETFQEYFATLYIYQDYQASGKLAIDLSAPEWTETFKLVAELVLLTSSSKSIVRFLSDISVQYSKNSNSLYFNDRMGTLAEILTVCSENSVVVHSWLAQYILFSMSNFLSMPEEERTIDRFKELLEAVAVVRDNDITLFLFRSFRWLKYWLYDEEKVDNPKGKIDTVRFNAMCTYLKRFINKTDIYIVLQNILNEYMIFECIGKRVCRLQALLLENMNEDENRRLYLANGDISALLRTGDLSFIEHEICDRSDLFIPDLNKKLDKLDQEIIYFIYDKLFEKLCEPNKEMLLSLQILPDMIMKAPGLDNLLLTKPQYEVYKISILKACYVVPDEFLSPGYFHLVEYLQENGLSQMKATNLKTLVQTADRKYYVEIIGPDDVASAERLCEKLMVEFIEARLLKMQFNYFNVIECGVDIDIEGCERIGPVFPLSKEIYPIITGNSLLLLCRTKTSYTRMGNKLYICTINGITYKLTLNAKMTKNIISADRPVDLSIRTFGKEKESKAYFLENYYLFRSKNFTPWQWEYLGNAGNDLKATMGVLGRYVSDMDPESRKFGVVKRTGKDFVVVQMRDKSTTVRYPHRFYKLMPGDIVLRYKRSVFLIEETEMINRYAMATGIVVSKNGYDLFIQTDIYNYSKDYYYYDETDSFFVGDVVRFFPLLNNCRKFVDNPMAYGIKKF